MNLSYKNRRAFMSKVDALPRGPEWTVDFLAIQGDLLDANGKPMEEIIELWRKDPVECVRELIGNPSFKDNHYAPIKIYEDDKGHIRVYGEMCSGDLWWKIQVSGVKQTCTPRLTNESSLNYQTVPLCHPSSYRPTKPAFLISVVISQPGPSTLPSETFQWPRGQRFRHERRFCWATSP
jgi:hypothetical protein